MRGFYECIGSYSRIRMRAVDALGKPQSAETAQGKELRLWRGSAEGTMYRATTEEHRLKPTPLGQGFEKKSELAVAGDVGERGEFEGVMAAGEFEGAGFSAMATQ